VLGDFHAINGVPRYNAARLLPDGRVDESFDLGPSFNPRYWSSSDIQANGQVIVMSGQNLYRLARQGEAVGDYRTPRRFANDQAGREVRQVLDCASPLALSGEDVGRKGRPALSECALRVGARAVEDYRTPRRFANHEAAANSARS